MKRYLIFLFLLSGLLWAQEYTLDQLIQTGLKNSTTIKTKAIQTDNAKSSLRSAYYDMLPEADVSLSSSTSKGDITSKSGKLSIYKSLSLNEPTVFNLKQSMYDNKSASLNFDQAQKQFVFDILAAYLDVLSATKEVDIQKANVALQERIFTDTQIQYQQGRKSAFDLNQADINRINSKITLQNSLNNLSNLRQDLFTLLLIKDDGYPFSEPDISLPVVDTVNTTIAPLGDQVNPLMIRMQDIQLKKDNLSLSQQKINFLPTLTAAYSYDAASIQNKPFDFSAYEDSYTISLTASYSLWNLFRHGEDYHRYKNSVKLSELELQDAKVQLKADYEKTMRNLQYMNSSYQLQVRKKGQAAENLRIAEEKYRLGLISLLDLDQAQVDDLNAKLSANSDYYSLLKTKEQLNLLLSDKILGKW
ncbi:MAG TPA: TolC family protein [Candidatus Cloacimonadota bacterium]|nr:TolC family protein [Candidatus Cloacimonadota bacterium]